MKSSLSKKYFPLDYVWYQLYNITFKMIYKNNPSFSLIILWVKYNQYEYFLMFCVLFNFSGEHPAAMQHGTSVTSCQSSCILMSSLVALVWLVTSILLLPGLPNVHQSDASYNGDVTRSSSSNENLHQFIHSKVNDIRSSFIFSFSFVFYIDKLFKKNNNDKTVSIKLIGDGC